MSSHDIMVQHGSGSFPRRLAEVVDRSRELPGTLHVRGHLHDAGTVVAIVGSRAARAGEVAFTRELAAALVERGTQVISGGALGVDAAAHRGALEAGAGTQGKPGTVAVLGCGLDVVYPERHQALFAEIVARGGALVSQFEADAPPRSWHFVLRNATIAAMADAVIVVAAGAQSGALHTARYARKFGRLVCARPGRAGCKLLITQGAALIRTLDDLEEALAGRPVRPDIALPEATSPTGQVLAYLDRGQARNVDEIALGTGLMVREVSRALMSLEIDGLAIPMPGRSYVRSTLAQELLVR